MSTSISYIRYNSSESYWEYDTSINKDGSGPWIILPLDASQISSGIFDASQIPDLSANKITSDTFDTARIPDLSATKITSDKLGLAQGGTGTDLSATGGTSQILQQSSSGAAITVAQLALSNLSDIVGPTAFTGKLNDSGTGSQPSGTTFSTNICYYQKIGTLVFFSFYLILSTVGSYSGDVCLGGNYSNIFMGYNGNSAYGQFPISYGSLNANWLSLWTQPRIGFSDFYLVGNRDIASPTNSIMVGSDLKAGSSLSGGGFAWCYF